MVLTVAAVPAAGESKPGKKRATLHRSRVDEDFAFQGEYTGTIQLVNNGYSYCRRVGLQVIARGGGKFDAVEYLGGLPGSGWDGEYMVALQGERSGKTVTLRDGPITIVLHDGYATVRYFDGDCVAGHLHKVRRTSPTLGAAPPRNARVLFDGTGTEHFRKARMTEDGLLKEGVVFKPTFRDFTLHLEYRLPYMPYARGQGRANSGVYLQSRYEVQILDSFGLEGRNNEAGGLYKYKAPDVNMAFPPLAWQTYDIHFTAPYFDADGNKVSNARISVYHNGVLIHDDVELKRKTGAGKPEGPEPLPIKLQNHGNPVRFRNIWVVEYERDCRTVPYVCRPRCRRSCDREERCFLSGLFD